MLIPMQILSLPVKAVLSKFRQPPEADPFSEEQFQALLTWQKMLAVN